MNMNERDDDPVHPQVDEEPFVHADLIRAALDGKVIQNFYHGKWTDLDPREAIQLLARWNPDDGGVRVKPGPVPVVNYVLVYRNGSISCGYPTRTQAVGSEWWNAAVIAVLRVEMDMSTTPPTVLSTTVEAP